MKNREIEVLFKRLEHAEGLPLPSRKSPHAAGEGIADQISQRILHESPLQNTNFIFPVSFKSVISEWMKFRQMSIDSFHRSVLNHVAYNRINGV